MTLLETGCHHSGSWPGQHARFYRLRKPVQIRYFWICTANKYQRRALSARI